MAKKFQKKRGRKLFDGKNEKKTKNKLEEAGINNFSLRETAIFTGISKSGLSRYLASNPEFRERFELLRNAPGIAAKRKIVSEIPHNVKAAMWWLEHKDEEFKRH